MGGVKNTSPVTAFLHGTPRTEELVLGVVGYLSETFGRLAALTALDLADDPRWVDAGSGAPDFLLKAPANLSDRSVCPLAVEKEITWSERALHMDLCFSVQQESGFTISYSMAEVIADG